MFAIISPVKFISLILFLFSGLFIHFRGRVRYKPIRQLTDHSTFMAPINALVYFFSKTPSTPYLNRQDFSELDLFKENWHIIKEEAQNLLSEGGIKASTKRDDIGFNSFFKRGWKRYYLKWYAGNLPSAEQTCPKTLALIAQVPSINAAMFTYLPAGSKLGLHRDPYAGSLRYHLGLITPNDDRCFIDVDGERYSWRDGEDVMFDETYLHQAENNTESDRLIFFCDVARPMKNQLADSINKFFGRYCMTAAAAQNVETDPIGFLNRTFKYIFMIHTSTRGLKRNYPRLHFILKGLLFGSLAYFVFF